jgi:hypothetical protein
VHRQLCGVQVYECGYALTFCAVVPLAAHQLLPALLLRCSCMCSRTLVCATVAVGSAEIEWQQLTACWGLLSSTMLPFCVWCVAWINRWGLFNCSIKRLMHFN